ncbi:uncharacterized protein [Macrobrachium rosenbergii]|uniref:uncharacterized protein isoform X2 n=1 Tax=Macrobrachium rosenbergii TaxID=79674 RepID=UPI0034D6416E
MSIILLIATGSMNRWPSLATSAASAEALEDRSDDLPAEDSSEELLQKDASAEDLATDASSEVQTRNARSVLGPMSFHSELQDDLPLAGNFGLPARKLSLRRKRRSGVVIRGPFYPYPRPGHPLRFTSGAPGMLSSSWLTAIVSSGLAVNLIAFWRT